jgi:hypothetical protein
MPCLADGNGGDDQNNGNHCYTMTQYPLYVLFHGDPFTVSWFSFL